MNNPRATKVTAMKLSEQPGFDKLPAIDREKILKAEAKRERKQKRRAALSEEQKK